MNQQPAALFPTPPAVAEPEAVANARRRDSSPWNRIPPGREGAVTDRRALLKVYDEQARRLSELESQLAELRADQKKQFEGGLFMKNFITEQGNELNKAKADLAAAEARATGLQTELAEQEKEKLALVQELAETAANLDRAGQSGVCIQQLALNGIITFEQSEEMMQALSSKDWHEYYRLPGTAPVRKTAAAPTLVGDETPALADSQLPFDPGFTPKCHGCGLPSFAARCRNQGCPAKHTVGTEPWRAGAGHPNAAQQKALRERAPAVGSIWQKKADPTEQVIICESTRWDSVAFRRHPHFAANPAFNRLRYKKEHYFLYEYEQVSAAASLVVEKGPAGAGKEVGHAA